MNINGGIEFKNVLSFGDDYRQFIESLSDSSVSSKLSVKRTKKYRRRGRRNQVFFALIFPSCKKSF